MQILPVVEYKVINPGRQDGPQLLSPSAVVFEVNETLANVLQPPRLPNELPYPLSLFGKARLRPGGGQTALVVAQPQREAQTAQFAQQGAGAHFGPVVQEQEQAALASCAQPVDVGAVFQQQVRHFVGAHAAHLMQGRQSGFVHGVDVGPSLQQLGNAGAAALRRFGDVHSRCHHSEV